MWPVAALMCIRVWSMAFKILLTSIDFRPQLGGVATCSYELAKALHEIPDVEIEFLAPEMHGHKEFDQTCPFPVHRAPLPGSFKAVLPLALKILVVCWSSRPNLVINMLWLPCGFATFLIRPSSVSPGYQASNICSCRGNHGIR